tara:strand:- start:678 stop:1991 length:1314 start_codon:yes stop_codon:yes gene_type:complete
MGGGLMQLVAYGAQDIYLTGNPQITFFKVVYRRHTNFSIEAIQQTFEGNASSLKEGGVRTCLISRNGDLVYRMWLEGEITYKGGSNSATYLNWTNNTGHALIEECDIEIGGQRIDKHTSQWLDIWNELTDHDEKEWIGLNKHSAKNAYLKSKNSNSLNNKQLRLYIPLKFWFCRNVGLALPLIALQYHEVKLNIKFRTIRSLLNADIINNSLTITESTSVCKLFVDYIFLDTHERRRFAQVSHEYLIEQLQYKKFNSNKNLKLDFNHPVKEIIWVMSNKTRSQSADSNNASLNASLSIPQGGGIDVFNDYFNYSNIENPTYGEYISNQISYEGFKKATIKLNGHTRFKDRNASYFRLCQPEQAGHKIPTKHIYVYSFALNPEEHQPSGTCNFSRLDNAHLSFDNVNDTNNKYFINIYAVSYNVLRIMSGMGGLAYSN